MKDRYKRHHIIKGWDQNIIKDATVVVVGIGAIGNEVARILSMTGIGKLIICDPDVVEVSNLSRCSLFTDLHIGKLKVDAAKDTLSKLSPTTIIDKRPYKLINGVGLAELRDASLIVSCLDSRYSRIQLAGRCNLVKAPYIDGGTNPWGGEVRPFLNPNDACYACGISETVLAVPDDSISCSNISFNRSNQGTTICSTALISSWMSLIAIRFLLNLSSTNNIIRVDASNGHTNIVRIKKNKNCMLHQHINSVKKIPVGSMSKVFELKRYINSNDIPLAWEAIRYKTECSKCKYEKNFWNSKDQLKCPICNHKLRHWSTYHLNEAPDDMLLSELGIASNEIIPVRTLTGMIWLELCG